MDNDSIYRLLADFVAVQIELFSRAEDRAALYNSYAQLLKGRLQDGQYDQESFFLVAQAHNKLDDFDKETDKLKSRFNELKESVQNLFHITEGKPFTVELEIKGRRSLAVYPEPYKFYQQNGEVSFQKLKIE